MTRRRSSPSICARKERGWRRSSARTRSSRSDSKSFTAKTPRPPRGPKWTYGDCKARRHEGTFARHATSEPLNRLFSNSSIHFVLLGGLRVSAVLFFSFSGGLGGSGLPGGGVEPQHPDRVAVIHLAPD